MGLVDQAWAARLPRDLRAARRLSRNHRAAIEVAAADRCAADHLARRRRHADRAQRGDGGRAGQGRRAARARDPALPRDRGPAVLRSLGRRSARDRTRGLHRRGRGQHDHPAARQVHLPDPRADAHAQGARGADRVLARSATDQGRDPRTLPLERLFRRQHVRAACGFDALFLPQAGEPEARTGGDAGRAAQGTLAACADQELRPRQGAFQAGRGLDGRGRLPDRSAGRRNAPAGARRPDRARPADRHLFRRLGAARGAQIVRGRL